MSNISEEILFDTVLLDEMGSQNSTIKVLEFYLDESPKYLLDFEKLMFERDIPGIIEKAHKLKSSLGMLKAELLVSLLIEVEVAAKELNFDKLQELFDLLKEKLQLLDAQLLFQIKQIKDGFKDFQT